MPLQLIAPIEKDFILTKTDEEFKTEGEPTKILIRQATQGQHERRNVLINTFNRQYDGVSVTVSQNFSPEDLYRLEVELTLADCNITGEDEKPLFIFTNKVVNSTSFMRGWSKLPPLVASEIHDKVLEVNPLWASPLAES